MATSLYKAQEALKTCDEHEHKELSFFCKTCNKFICISCGKSTHLSHDWDLIASVAKVRRKETPQLCRKIKKEKLRKYKEKLRGVDKAIEQSRQKDIAKLEERQTAFMDVVNRIINEQKRRRNDLARESSETMKRNNRALEKKLEYLEKMTRSLDSNITAYSDYDLLEMEKEMLTVLNEIEANDLDLAVSIVKFAPGQINQGLIEKMIGAFEEMAMPNVNDRVSVEDNDHVSVEEVRAFENSDNAVFGISPVSNTHAWVGYRESDDIRLLSLQKDEIECCISLTSYSDFVALGNDDFIVNYYDKQVIRRVTLHRQDNVFEHTKPLHPTYISKTRSNDILVGLKNDGDDYELKPSSRRCVQRMSQNRKVLRTYEFQKDGTTRLFTYLSEMTENGNSDICVINRTSDGTGELIVLRRDGRVRFTYRGNHDVGFNPSSVASDECQILTINPFIC